jgi:hypothetical protein
MISAAVSLTELRKDFCSVKRKLKTLWQSRDYRSRAAFLYYGVVSMFQEENAVVPKSTYEKVLGKETFAFFHGLYIPKVTQ